MKLSTVGLVAATVSVLLACETFDTFITELSDSLNTNISAAQDASRKNAKNPGSSNLSPLNKRADPDAANWDITTLDTAKDVEYLSGVEKDVILEMNKVRTDPKKYAELYIQPRLRYYDGKNYSVPGQITIVTREGAAAVNTCVTALRRARSTGVLLPSRGHRANIMKSDYTQTGLSIGTHPKYRNMCVVAYAKGYVGN